jgi:hypothetical protein
LPPNTEANEGEGNSLCPAKQEHIEEMASVNFVNEGKTLDALPGANLREIALRSGIQLDHPLLRIFYLNLKAGPLKIFSASDVVLVDGKGVDNRLEEGEKALSGRFLRKFKMTPGMRLASQVSITGDVAVRTRVRREVDAKLTKEQTGYLALVSSFGIVMLLMLLLVGLDIVKKM